MPWLRKWTDDELCDITMLATAMYGLVALVQLMSLKEGDPLLDALREVDREQPLFDRDRLDIPE